MDVDLYINSSLRTDLEVITLRRSYVDPWTAEIRDEGRHDAGDHPALWSNVRVERSSDSTVLFKGELTDVEPGGVSEEGAIFTASGARWRLQNTNVRINGRSHYAWNHRGGTGETGDAGYDSPGKDGEKWTAGEICVDILEHAFGTNLGVTTTTGGGSYSAISGHHSDDEDITDTYLTSGDISGWTPSEWLALDTVIGEFSVEDTSVADALQLLISRAGGFYGWYIDASAVLHLVDLDTLTTRDIEAGVQGHWIGEDGTDYRLLQNQLRWSLDGVATTVIVQGQDKTVEEKPNNIEGSGNSGKGDLGELEKLSEPWEGYASAYRPRYQDKRHITLKTIDDANNYTPPDGWWNFNHAPRLYKGTPSGSKTFYNPGGGAFPDVIQSCDAVGLYDTPSFAANEKLWLWYWAEVPFTVTSGPGGDAYENYGYERTLTFYDESFKHPDSYPQSGDASESTRMQTLADRLLDQRQDVRRQGTLRVDGVDPDTHDLDARFNVLNLGPTTTTSGASTTTAAGTTTTSAPPPTEWESLQINAVEVTYDLERDATDIRVANTFFMLDGYSEIRRRLKNNLGRARERNRRYYNNYIYGDRDTPSGTKNEPTTTTTAAPTTTTCLDTLGGSSEAEAAQSDSWNRSTNDCGLLDTRLVRMAYDHQGAETLYGYYRTYQYDRYGNLTAVSAETRKVIDTPEPCDGTGTTTAAPTTTTT